MTSGNPWTDNIERSCPVLYFHFFWGLTMIILGWTTFSIRFIEKYKKYHRSMGQIWIYGMIIQLYTSTYCRRDGFRWFIFMFGVLCYGGMIIGHLTIRKLQRDRDAIAIANNNIDQPIPQYDTNPGQSSSNYFNMDQKPFKFDLITLKKIHGGFMLLSLIMVTGAGAAFTKRFADVGTCYNIYSPA